MVRKVFFIFFTSIFLHINGSTQTSFNYSDTLQWLRTNIEQREQLFIHKPLKVMLDSLYELKGEIIQYFSPETISWILPDTIWTNDIALYFGEPWGGGEISQLHDSIPEINTHVPVIVIEFSWPVPFLSKWYSIDPDGLGSTEWNPKLEAFWGRYWIKSIRIEEY